MVLEALARVRDFLVASLVGAVVWMFFVELSVGRFEPGILLVFPLGLLMVTLMTVVVAGPIALAGSLVARWVALPAFSGSRFMAGAMLGAATYLVWVALGVGSHSYVNLSFWNNLRQSFQWQVRIPAAMAAGMAGWRLFKAS